LCIKDRYTGNCFKFMKIRIKILCHFIITPAKRLFIKYSIIRTKNNT